MYIPASGEDVVAFGRFSMDLRGEDLGREPVVPGRRDTR